MEVWDREQLYNEIWESPLVKLAAKYGISAVALGKVCRKLQIPLPGRGYWVKKEFGKPVERVPLPKAVNLPVVHRMKTAPTSTEPVSETASGSATEDPEVVRIGEIESDNFSVDPEAKRHKIVSATSRILKHASTDARKILCPPYSEACLDIRVSKSSLERALALMNAIILRIEALTFSVTSQKGPEHAQVEIDGRRIRFELVEKTRVKNRREVTHGTWTTTEMEYEPTGELELRIGHTGYGWHQKFADGKTRKLEDLLSKFVGAFMREGRRLRIEAELAKQREIENQKRQHELWKLRELIDEEEKKVSNLDMWVTNWERAEQIRAFVTALEKVWTNEGHDLSPEAPKGQRMVWMRQQADRLDPLIYPNPPSILDRKDELSRW